MATRPPAGKRKTESGRAWLGRAVWAGGSLPLVLLVYRFFTGKLGAEPVAVALNQLGLLALILLLASLACTPLRIVTKAAWPIALRRTLGLLGFGYATLHVLTYAVVDQGLDVPSIIADLTQRPFTIFGGLAYLCLLPLAFTSTKKAVQMLGAVKWRRIHRLAYAVSALGVVHFTLRVKKDLTEPLIYGSVLAVLLGIRVVDSLRRKRLAT